MSKEKILVVADEQDLVKLVRHNLEKDGYKVVTAYNGEDALFLARKVRPELVILDHMLPDIDSLEICKKLKAEPELANVAIVMLAAKGEEVDITQGLKLGVDAYVTKPFGPKELVAHVRAVLRRSKSTSTTKDYIKIDTLTIDLDKHEVTIKNEPVQLTLTEFKLLHQLVSKPGHVFTRDQLIDAVSGSETFVIGRTVDVHIVSLRKKLKACANHIVTIRGIGYKFKEYLNGYAPIT
jgi:DNA-binding response OmpR family regulator